MVAKTYHGTAVALVNYVSSSALRDSERCFGFLRKKLLRPQVDKRARGDDKWLKRHPNVSHAGLKAGRAMRV